MKPLHIPRPIFKHSQHSPQAYIEGMIEHVRECEEYLRARNEIDDEGWGIGQLWVMEHKDGRIANLPDQCPYEKLHRKSEKQQKAWMRYYMKNQERKTIKTQNTMNKKQKAKYSGNVLFNGEINVGIGGEKKTLEIDYIGTRIRNADPNREIIVMLKKNIGYNELETGYVCRHLAWEEGEHAFGLRPNLNTTHCTLVNYGDVIAWGYASEKDETSENIKKHVEEIHNSPIYQRAKKKIQDTNVCIAIQKKDGQINIKAIIDKNEIEAYLVVSADYLAQCLTTFQDFTKDNPDIKEMHFFTKAQEWKEEE